MYCIYTILHRYNTFNSRKQTFYRNALKFSLLCILYLTSTCWWMFTKGGLHLNWLIVDWHILAIFMVITSLQIYKNHIGRKWPMGVARVRRFIFPHGLKLCLATGIQRLLPTIVVSQHMMLFISFLYIQEDLIWLKPLWCVGIINVLIHQKNVVESAIYILLADTRLLFIYL